MTKIQRRYSACLAVFLVTFARPGLAVAPAAGKPGLGVSSSAIRARAAAASAVRSLVPDRVTRYIARHQLYRSAP